MDRSSTATASISTPTGSFCHLTAEFPEPVVKAFLGDPTPPAKFPFCQPTVGTFLNKHSPCLRPIVVPHCQYICHLIAPLPPSRKTLREFFKFWDIISHPWVRCHAGGYCALTPNVRCFSFYATDSILQRLKIDITKAHGLRRGLCVGATYLLGPSPAKYCGQKRA